MEVMARKKREEKPGARIAREIIAQHNPTSVEEMQDALK